METNNLIDTQFKTVANRMPKELSENFNRDRKHKRRLRNHKIEPVREKEYSN